MLKVSVDVKGLEETNEGLRNLIEIHRALGVGLAVDERSKVITSVHGVADAFPDAIENGDDLEQAWVESLADLRISELNAAEAESRRDRIRQGMARALRTVWVGLIDELDLIDTGRYREDVESAAPVFDE